MSSAAPKKPTDDGLVNPNAALGTISTAPFIFIAGVPLTNFITRPNGIFEKLLTGIINTSAWVGTAGSTSSVPANRIIPALSALYLFGTYTLGGASSAAAIAGSSRDGRDNKNPRAQVRAMSGFPLRAHSAHAHLMEVFPSFALAAGLTATLDPNNRQLLSLLGLHVVSKLFVFWPAYLFDVDAARTLGHVLATSSLLSVAYKLALGS